MNSMLAQSKITYNVRSLMLVERVKKTLQAEPFNAAMCGRLVDDWLVQ